MRCVDEFWKKEEKYRYLDSNEKAREIHRLEKPLTPDARGTLG